MNCNEIGERILDFIDGELGETEAVQVREHLADCAACRAEAEAAGETWSLMGRMDGAGASEAMRARFSEMLARFDPRETSPGFLPGLSAWLGGLWPRRPALQAALALGALVIGVGIGLIAAPGRGSGGEIRELRAEMESMNRTMVLSMLDNRSASERLRAVSLTQAAPPDRRVTDALLQAITTDPSVNVRLAALDVLSRMAGRPEVRERLLQALPRQSSPTMTVAMADVLMAVDGPRSRAAIENTMKEKELPDDVKEYLRNALSEEH